jgi:hypothetical protein
LIVVDFDGTLPPVPTQLYLQKGVFMRFGRLRLLPVSVLLAVGLLGSVNATDALAWCNTSGLGRGNYNGNFFDGMSRYPGGTVGGVYGTIGSYDPYVFSGFSAVWIMFSYNSQYWGQIGYWVNPGSPGWQRGFVQVNEPGVFDTYYWPMPGGSSISYSAYWNNTPGYLTFYQNGARTRSDPANFTPNAGNTDGETGNTGNQMFGGSIDHVSLSNMHIYAGGWQDFNGSPDQSFSYYGNGIQSSQWAVIWDNACGQ